MIGNFLSACVGVLLWENLLTESTRKDARAVAGRLWEHCQRLRSEPSEP